MGELTPREIEKLILGYEELDEADRNVADNFLGRQPELLARLKWHQDKEAVAVTSPPLLEEYWEKETLLPSDEVAQMESLQRMLASLDQANNSGPGHFGGGTPRQGGKILGFTDRLRHQALWILPLAAVLALAVLMPRGGTEKILLENLRLTQIELQDDGSRGFGQSSPADGVLHTGEAFALDFSLNEDAFVVVYHVGPAGQVSRVYPGTITDTLSPHRGGQGHQIPDPASQEVWVLGSETGTESFLVASSSELPVNLEGLQADPSIRDRAKVLANIKDRLESVMTQVDLYEFHHVD